MQQPHHRGTRGGEKARKRAYYESSDAVRADARRLFRGVPWVRVDFSDATPAFVQAFSQIAANPGQPNHPAWVVVAGFNAALLPHLAKRQVTARRRLM